MGTLSNNLTAACIALGCLLSSSMAFAADPNIAVQNVAAGSASFSGSNTHTNITASNGAVINYSKFNVNAGHSVNFIQPSSSAKVLNRITGPDPSTINGSITANGHVYFVNPAGITFGAGSVINVGRLYAAAGNITDQNFAAGINQFSATGTLTNNGSIFANDGAHLVGR